MTKLIEKIKRMQLGKNTLWFIVMLLFGAAMFYALVFVLGPMGPFSRFPTSILLMYIGILALMYMDKIHFGQINTTQAILNNNTAYGLIILAYAMIIAAVITTV